MKFQPDRSDAQTIQAHGPGWVAVGGEKLTASCILTWDGQRLPWPAARFDDLTAAHFAQLATLAVEVVIFGSGTRNRFVPPAWLAPLMAARVGLETMDTPAACRTYNVLASEGRKAAVALLLEPAPPPALA